MRVYLDHNSTTPVDERVLKRMAPFFSSTFGNPSSTHSFGAEAAHALEQARAAVGALVGAEPEHVTFCASATEATNTIIRGIQTGTVISSVVEHPATLESLEQARSRGAAIRLLEVDGTGMLDILELRDALEAGAALVTVLWANNETGVLFPVESIAQLCAQYEVPLHVDAVQAAGKVPIDITEWPIDYLSISSHKIFGPKGAAALVARPRSPFSPLIVGGGQEHGRRAGTENVPAIVGFGAAAQLASAELGSRMDAARELRDCLEGAVLEQCRLAWVNGHGSPRIGNTASIGFPGIDADALVSVLDTMGVAASTGSACHAHSTVPSHVIRAMTGSYERASETVRFSVSHLNTRAEIEFAATAVGHALQKLRSNGPLS